MTEQTASLVDQCLIATPAIKDPIFASSLIYMCEHSEHGSMGLVVNHETTQVLDPERPARVIQLGLKFYF